MGGLDGTGEPESQAGGSFGIAHLPRDGGSAGRERVSSVAWSRPPRRVALAIGQLQVGGTEGQVVLLAKGLSQRGIDVAVAVLCETGPYEEDLLAAGIPMFKGCFPAWRRAKLRDPAPWRREKFLYPFRFGVALARYTRWLREWGPDVVHAFLYYAYVLTPLAAHLARVPVMVASRRSLGSFKAERPWALRLERLANAFTDLVVANATAVAEDACRQERLSRERLTVIYNGISPERFRRRRAAALKPEGPVILCVANFRPVKGHEVLFDAVDRLRANGLRCTLALAGDGPDRLRIETLADKSSADVRLLGRRADVSALLAAADVVVLPSLHEGLSNTLLEAMAAGRPIVATDVGGNAEALHGAGLLVPSRDPVALASAIKRLIENPAEARSLGITARRRAAKHFSHDSMVERHIAAYRRLLS